MVHEVMVLDHSGPPLAVIMHGAALKLLLFSVFLTESVLPVGAIGPIAGIVLLIAGVLTTALGVGLVESLMARFAFRRVPLLLLTAVLLVAWRAGVLADFLVGDAEMARQPVQPFQCNQLDVRNARKRHLERDSIMHAQPPG
jgi:hypothetical protein